MIISFCGYSKYISNKEDETIVLKIMPDKNKTNLGLAPVFLLIQRCARVLYV